MSEPAGVDPSEPRNAPQAPASEGAGSGARPDAKPAGDGPFSLKLAVACVTLWVLAIGLIVKHFGTVQLDYYLGNLVQGMAQENRIDPQDVQGILALGPAVLPRLQSELNAPNAHERLCVAIITVIGAFPNEHAVPALKSCLGHRIATVRGNACFQLLGKIPEPEFIALAEQLLSKDDPAIRLPFLMRAAPRLTDRKGSKRLLLNALREEQVALRLLGLFELRRLNRAPGDFPEATLQAAPKEAWDRYAEVLTPWLEVSELGAPFPLFPEPNAPAAPTSPGPEAGGKKG